MAALLKEYLGTSYLFGANAPFIEELYEAYLADPASVPPEWRRYFDQLQQLPGSPDVAHEPIRQSFVKLVKAPRAAAAHAPTASSAEVGRKQVWVLQLANNYRRLGHAARQRRSAEALREAEHPRARSRVLRPDRSGHGGDVQHRVDVRARADAAARDPARAARDLLRLDRRGVQVHHRSGASAAGSSSASRAYARAAELLGRLQALHPRAADRRRDAGAATCTRATSGRSASRSRAARA